MKTIKLILILNLVLFFSFCDSKVEQKVPLEQLNPDNSNDYKYIFKDIISEEKKQNEQNKEDPFLD